MENLCDIVYHLLPHVRRTKVLQPQALRGHVLIKRVFSCIQMIILDHPLSDIFSYTLKRIGGGLMVQLLHSP